MRSGWVDHAPSLQVNKNQLVLTESNRGLAEGAKRCGGGEKD